MKTLEKPISLQDIFDAAWQAFIIEDKPPSIDNRNGCQYISFRGGIERRCAVGLCLPYENTAELCEDLNAVKLNGGIPFSAICNIHPEWFDNTVKDLGSDLLNEFQVTLHDRLCHYTGYWDTDLEARKLIYLDVAKKYHLKVPE